MPCREEDITVLLRRSQDPADRAARERLYREVERELRGLARSLLRGGPSSHLLESTVLVDEAFLRLVNATGYQWESCSQFYRLAFGAMRRILADHTRRRRPALLADAVSRSLPDPRSPAPDRRLQHAELLGALAAALEKLKETDPEASKTFMLCFFHHLHQSAPDLGPSDYPGRNLPLGEVASQQGRSRTTTHRILRRALAFLQAQLQGVAPDSSQ